MINKHEDNLQTILGEVPKSKFKMALQNHFLNARQKVKEVSALRSKKEKELTELEMKRKHLKDKLKAKEEVLRTNEEDIYEICGSDDFDETVSRLQKEIEELQDIKGTLSSSEFMYQRFVKILHTQKRKTFTNLKKKKNLFQLYSSIRKNGTLLSSVSP